MYVKKHYRIKQVTSQYSSHLCIHSPRVRLLCLPLISTAQDCSGTKTWVTGKWKRVCLFCHLWVRTEKRKEGSGFHPMNTEIFKLWSPCPDPLRHLQELTSRHTPQPTLALLLLTPESSWFKTLLTGRYCQPLPSLRFISPLLVSVSLLPSCPRFHKMHRSRPVKLTLSDSSHHHLAIPLIAFLYLCLQPKFYISIWVVFKLLKIFWK